MPFLPVPRAPARGSKRPPQSVEREISFEDSISRLQRTNLHALDQTVLEGEPMTDVLIRENIS